MDNTPDPLPIHEILSKLSSAKKKATKLEFIKKHNSIALRDILKGAFDDSIVWDLPEGLPPYENKLSTEGSALSDLRRQTTKFTYFCKGGAGKDLHPAKRERIFLEVLESVLPEDAKVVIAMKEKKLDTLFPGVTKDLVKEAFPRLIVK